MSLAYFGFRVAHTPRRVWPLFVFYAFYFALTEGAERAMVADLVRRRCAERPSGPSTPRSD